jgi:hypothetical protein
VNINNYHTIIRTVLLVDIPAAIFLVASAIIGWPIAITKHELFFWLGLIAFGSITGIAIAKLGHKTYLSSKKDAMNLRIWEVEERQRVLAPSPDNTASSQIMLEEDDVSKQSQSGVPMLSGVPLSQSVPRGTAATIDDFNVTVAMYLSQYPHASIREVERATRIPKSTIGRTPAWQNRIR